MSLSTLFHVALGFLALVGAAAITLGFMLASPVRPPPPLASIHEGAMRMDTSGAPYLSRYQARDGTWLAYRLYPATNGAKDRIAILAHGSSASSIEMHAVATAARRRGRDGGRRRHPWPRRLGDARRHRLSRPARRRSRRSHRRAAQGLSGRPVLADRPFGGRRVRAAHCRKSARRYVRPLRAARALPRLFGADQPAGGRAGPVGLARHCRASSRP